MAPSLELGQIFWLIIPLFKKKLQARPFLVYGKNEIEYTLLKITKRKKDYIPQFEFIPNNKPSGLYETSFVDSNILVYIKHDLFSYKLNETVELKEQGQTIFQKDFNEITKGVIDCFSNEKFRGNRYEVRVK